MSIPAARTNSSYANAAAITAISPNNRQDGDPAFNADTGIGYHFQAAAESGGLAPDLGTGRWIADATVAGAVAASDLASTAGGGLGSGLVGDDDPGNFTAKTTVGEQVQELYQHLFSAVGGYIPIPLSAWREVSATGDVGNIAANGGGGGADTTPVFDAVATSNEEEILWATGNVDPIGVSVVLPRDFDDTANATLDLVVSSGTTNAATIVCDSAWSAGAAGTEVSDSTTDTASATPHTLSITIAAGDIPSGARRATIRLTPPTHATDTISLYATGIAYKRKLLTA